MKNKPFICAENHEGGSIILVVLLILTLLTVAGISATYMSTTESFIVRNATIHKQNLQMAEAAAYVGARRILNLDEEPQKDWIFDINDDPAENTRFYELGAGEKIDDNVEIYTPYLLEQRGEAGDETLWYYFVWTFLPDIDETEGKFTDDHEGKVVGVYNSRTYGRAAVEVGIRKAFDIVQ